MNRCEKQPEFGIFNCVEVTEGGGGGGCIPSILMCDTMCRWNSPPFSDPRNTSIGHFADLCKLHWVILNVVSLGQILYILNKTILASYLCLF